MKTIHDLKVSNKPWEILGETEWAGARFIWCNDKDPSRMWVRHVNSNKKLRYDKQLLQDLKVICGLDPHVELHNILTIEFFL